MVLYNSQLANEEETNERNRALSPDCWDCTRWRIYIISPVFPGRILDKDITVKSGLLNRQMWEPGKELMADRGFTLEDYFYH